MDLVHDIDITFSQAALGAIIEIEGLSGKINFKIPEGTQSGEVFRLKGKGLPGLKGNGQGDQLVGTLILYL